MQPPVPFGHSRRQVRQEKTLFILPGKAAKQKPSAFRGLPFIPGVNPTGIKQTKT
jgi:hypothetical protein